MQTAQMIAASNMSAVFSLFPELVASTRWKIYPGRRGSGTRTGTWYEVEGYERPDGSGENVFLGATVTFVGGTAPNPAELVDGLPGGSGWAFTLPFNEPAGNTYLVFETSNPVSIASLFILNGGFAGSWGDLYIYAEVNGAWVLVKNHNTGYVTTPELDVLDLQAYYPQIRLRATQDNGITDLTYKYFTHLYEFGVFSEVDAGGVNLSLSAEVVETSDGVGVAAIDGDDGTRWLHFVASFMYITLGKGGFINAKSARILFREWGVPNEVVLEKWDGAQFVVVKTLNPVSDVPLVVNF